MARQVERDPRLGQSAALAAAVLWGTSWVAMAIVLNDIPVLEVAFLRGLLQSIALAILVGLGILFSVRIRSEYRFRSMSRAHLRALAFLGLLGGTFNVAQAFAIDLSGPSVAALVAAQYPLVAALVAPVVLDERLTARRLVALAMATIGVAFIAMPVVGEAPKLGGLVWGAAAALSFGLYLVAARLLTSRHDLPPLSPTFSVFVTAAAMAGLVLLLTGASVSHGLGTTNVLALGWLVAFAGIVPLALAEVAVRLTATVRIAPYLFITPIVGAVLGMALFDDLLMPLQIVGGALAVGGVALATTGSDSFGAATTGAA